MREEHGAPPCHATDLRECRRPITPMVGTQNRERCVGALRRKRQLLGSAKECRWERRGSLTDHRLRRLHRDDLQAGRLVRARPGADVHDGSGVAEGRPNCVRDPRIGSAGLRVGDADLVVESALDEASLDRCSSRDAGQAVVAARPAERTTRTAS